MFPKKRGQTSLWNHRQLQEHVKNQSPQVLRSSGPSRSERASVHGSSEAADAIAKHRAAMGHASWRA